MSLPGDSLPNTTAPLNLTAPDNLGRPTRTEDYERGGIALSDPTQGLLLQNWRIRLDGNAVKVGPEPYNVETTLFSEPGIIELSLAFDQNMRPVVAYIVGNEAKLRFFNNQSNSTVTESFGTGYSSVFVTMDDKRAPATTSGINDVLFFYIRSGALYYRQQRELYQIERLIANVPAFVEGISRVGMSVGLRLQVEMAVRMSTAYTDKLTDTLYISGGSDVLPMYQDADTKDAVWRSKTFVLNHHPSFAWCMLEGEYPAQVALYGDGVMFYVSPTITSRRPFRLPARKFREWQVEVRSSRNVTSVKLANSLDEFRD